MWPMKTFVQRPGGRSAALTRATQRTRGSFRVPSVPRERAGCQRTGSLASLGFPEGEGLGPRGGRRMKRLPEEGRRARVVAVAVRENGLWLVCFLRRWWIPKNVPVLHDAP